MDRQSIQIRKILRSPTVKRKNKTVPISERVVLERVLGLTVTNNAALDCDPVSGNIAYLAGCVVVLYNPKKGKQSHVFNTSKKTLTCLAYSRDGKYLVTGEAGHQPAVRVWDLEEKTQVAEFLGHKYGIACVAFSPNFKYVLSIGTEHDMMINVWNWRTGIKVASNKVASKVIDAAFSEDSSMIVAVGNRHVKFWYLDASKSKIKTETAPLQGRNGILGEHKNNFFCGVCCGKGQRTDTVFAITESGLLCEFNDQRLLSKWVQLRTEHANAIANSDRHIFVGCANGLVRLFDASTLHFLATMPCPHHLGVDVSGGISLSTVGMVPENARFPDTVAVCYTEVDNRLTCVYNDHSIYIWDVSDIRKVGKTRSFLFHSGAVWGIDAATSSMGQQVLPVGSFVTCSSDNTIRMWNCDSHMSADQLSIKRNFYSHELLKILYVDSEQSNLLDIAYNPAGKKDKTDTGFQEKNGIRSVRLNHTGDYLASGDRAGNVRIHELRTMKQVACLEAHDSEVLCLEFAPPNFGVQLLATASRDRLLHVFDINHNYGLVQTLDDHSSAITAVRFTQLDNQCMMLSCGIDKSVLFRNTQLEPDFRFVLNRHMVSRTTLYDMEVHPSGKFVATACQDRNIRIYNTRNGKQQKCYSGSMATDGTLLRLELDPAGRYVATSSSDKTLNIFEFFTGECAATMFGHSEVSTGIKFLDNGKHFVSVSVDGCIFVWRLPSEMTEHTSEKQTITSCPESLIPESTPDVNSRRETFVVTDKKQLIDSNDNFRAVSASLNAIVNDSPDASSLSPQLDYRFSVGQLPSWAKRQVLQESYIKTPTATGQAVQAVNVAPKGRWASRFDDQGLVFKSVMDCSTVQDKAVSDEPAGVLSMEEVPKVSFITDDDENNCDEDIEDEFKLRRSLDSKMSIDSDTSLKLGLNDRLSRQLSMSTEDDDEDDDESNSGDAKETVYYMPCTEIDADTNSESVFKVHEEAVDKLSTSDDDEEVVKSPIYSSREDPSSISSSDDAHMHDQFDENGISRERFDSSLKKLEEAVNVNMSDHSSSSSVSSRQSISALFLSKSNLPGLSRNSARDMSNQHDRHALKHSEDTKKRTSNEGQTGVKNREASVSSASTASRRLMRLSSTDNSKSTLNPMKFTGHDRKSMSTMGNADDQSARKWKSMFDVSGGKSGSPSVNTVNSPVSPTKSQRSKTPTFSVFSKAMNNTSGSGVHRRTSSPSAMHYDSRPVTPDVYRATSNYSKGSTADHCCKTRIASISPSSRIPALSFRDVASTDMKGDHSSSTLPRTTSRQSKGRHSDVQHSLASHEPSSQMLPASSFMGSAAQTDASDTSAYNKRRSAAINSHSYRMQTESSLAKVNGTKDGPDPVVVKNNTNRKESLGANRFQSTPNLIEATPDENIDVNNPATKNWSAVPASVDDDSFGKVSLSAGLEAIMASRRSDAPSKTELNRSKTFSGSSRDVSATRAAAAVISKLDRTLMPPPATASVPSSIQAAFIAKAEKHRRSTASEGSSTAVHTKDNHPVDLPIKTTSSFVVSSAPTMGTRAESILLSSGVSHRDFDASPLEPPERDTVAHAATGLTDIQAITKRLTDLGSQLMSVTSMAASTSSSVIIKDAPPSNTRTVKIGRCTSPLRPYVTKTAPTYSTVSQAHGDVRQVSTDSILSSSAHRRQLPADPKSSDKPSTDEIGSLSPDRLPVTSFEGLQLETTVSNLSVRPGSESILQSLGKFSSASNMGLSESGKLNSGRSSLGSSMRSTASSSLVASCSSPVSFTATQNISSITPERSTVSSLLEKHSHNQWDQISQNKLENAQSVPESRVPPPHLVYEIERLCEERRRSKDHGIAERSDRLQGTDHPTTSFGNQHAMETAAEVRNQWDRARQIKPFSLKSSPSYVTTKPLILPSTMPSADDILLTSVSENNTSSLGRRSVSSSASSVGSVNSETREVYSPSPLDSATLTGMLTNSRRLAHHSTPDGITLMHPSRRSRAQQLISAGVASGMDELREGEPSGMGVDTSSAIRLATGSPSYVILPTSGTSSGTMVNEPHSSHVMQADDTVSVDAAEEDCYKLASEMSQVVTRATDTYVQMSGNIGTMKDVDQRGASNERALRLLRDSLNDANALLGKTLGLVDDRSRHSTVSEACVVPDEATSRVIETMLERYSEQLSAQVYELFRRKLDEDLQNDATKL